MEVFNKYKESANCEDSPQNKFDSRNRKILGGTFQADLKLKIATAHHGLVVPVYLLEIEENQSVKQIVNKVVYSNVF